MELLKHFERSPSDLVAERASWRSYDRKALEPSVRDAFRAWLAAAPPAPFGREVRLHLLERFDAQEKGVKLGTYGMITGAVNFLVGAVKEGPQAMEDFGYVFELALLKATDLGLGSCWLGGTLKRSAFAAAAAVPADFVVPAVSPLGRPVNRRMLDRAVRFFAGSKHRKDPAELFFDGRFGLSLDLCCEADSPWVEALSMLRLGPSASNKQPWRVLADATRKRFDFFIQRSPGYLKLAAADLQRVDLGIGMAHFALGMAEHGASGRFLLAPEGGQGLDMPKGMEYVATWQGD